MHITKRDRLTLLDRALIGILLLLVVLLLGVQLAKADTGGGHPRKTIEILNPAGPSNI